MERFYRPTVVIGINDGEGKGSGRSIKGFHMVEGLRQCAGHLAKFGGHEFAGGLSIAPESVTDFAVAFEKAASHALAEEELIPLLEVDTDLTFDQISQQLMRELDALKPFGVGNAEPVFMTVDAEIIERRPFAAGIRYRLKQSGRMINAVYFGADGDTFGNPGDRIDVVYRLSENHWNGTTSIELRVADLRPAAQTDYANGFSAGARAATGL